MDKALVKKMILANLPNADVRTDRCELVRIHGDGTWCVISKEDTCFRIEFSLRDQPDEMMDFLPDSTVRVTALDEEEAASCYIKWRPVVLDLIRRISDNIETKAEQNAAADAKRPRR